MHSAAGYEFKNVLCSSVFNNSQVSKSGVKKVAQKQDV